jgi:hypothetical protein
MTKQAATILSSVRSDLENTAPSWTLMVNKPAETDAPTGRRLSSSRRLKPFSNDKVQCTFRIRIKILGLKSSYAELFRRNSKDEPIIYEPSLLSTSKLDVRNRENLGSINLLEFCDYSLGL